MSLLTIDASAEACRITRRETLQECLKLAGSVSDAISERYANDPAAQNGAIEYYLKIFELLMKETRR